MKSAKTIAKRIMCICNLPTSDAPGNGFLSSSILKSISSEITEFADQQSNLALEEAAKKVRWVCKAQECENRCIHEHSIRALMTSPND